jgi:hypothetical protein
VSVIVIVAGRVTAINCGTIKCRSGEITAADRGEHKDIIIIYYFRRTKQQKYLFSCNIAFLDDVLPKYLPESVTVLGLVI